MSSTIKKERSSSKKAAQEAASSAEKPARRKSKSSDTRQQQAASEEASQAVSDMKNRARVTESQVENVSARINQRFSAIEPAVCLTLHSTSLICVIR